ncbi:Ohr subfamily peroxiredoxin [Alloscardovia macacae]|uniref:Ohr subfamily peroxiredoxin n=1 Tax=Alloscardovia macacae TaxID=1160091 RepID=A0A1Y2SYZ3_9BIFI|nr:Ohr family peroxiredoxin [Alloscardovia macacae]OTA27378.1 Ohr subfamily peroxiredoxin [Alloscardovia macacae]OTA29390.1 Ohr subfamily peroxiredoxin [Alloscardovia macacae]
MVTYTAVADVTGGRSGHATTVSPAAEFDISAPVEMGGTGEGYNPEQLFAVGWGACYQGALMSAAREKRVNGMLMMKSRVRAHITLVKDDNGPHLSAKLEVFVPELSLDQVQELIDLADTICPYTKATAGNMPYEVVPVESL